MDSHNRYGAITRALHWLTAALVIWQFTMVALYTIFGESPGLNAVARFGPHGYVGLAILALALIRLGWAGVNRGRRPPGDDGTLGRAARTAHKVFYGLMIVIPTIAVVRIWGKGKGWEIAGVQVVPATGREIEPLVKTIDLMHGPLSWVLLALVGGHALMAALHGVVWRDGSTARMVGSRG